MGNFIKKNNLLFLSILLVILFSLHLTKYYTVAGNDNSIVLSEYQFFSKTVDTFQIENKITLIDKDKITLNNEFLISYFRILFDYFNIAPHTFNKIYLFLILYIGTISLYKLSSYFYNNNIISILCSLLFFISGGFIDYYLMGWNYVLIQLFLSPCFFYLIIKFFEQKSKFNIYLIYIFLTSIILLTSFQSIFLIVCVFIFSFLFHKNKNFLFFIFFLILFTLFSIQFPIFANLISENHNDLMLKNSHLSSISKGLAGVINPFYNFIQFNNFVNNFTLHLSIENSLKPLILLIPSISWLGYAIFVSKKPKKKYRKFHIFFILFFLLEFFLYFSYKTIYFFPDSFFINYIDKILIIFRDPSRLGNVNNFLIYIFLGYSLNYLYLISKRIKLLFFFKALLLIIITSNIYIYYKSTSINTISKPVLTSNFIEKNIFLENTTLKRILFLPITPYINLNNYAVNMKNLTTLDPVIIHSLNNTFFWNTDKNSKDESEIVNCDQAYRNFIEKIDCINNINNQIHYVIDKNIDKNLFINFTLSKNKWLNKNPQFTTKDFNNFIVIENSLGSFDNKTEIYGLYKNKINEEKKYFKIYNIQPNINEAQYSFKNFFLVKFIVLKDITSQKILNIKSKGHYLYYSKRQFYYDCMVLFSSFICLVSIMLLIYVKFIKNEENN